MKHINHLLLACLIISALGMMHPPMPARAATTITVNTTDDETANNGQCSLREAITNANIDDNNLDFPDCPAGSGTDTIVFASSLNEQSIQLSSDLPAITDADGLTINGGTNKITVNGNTSFQIFHITAGTVTLQNLTIEYGSATNGGNIFNAGTLSLQGSTLIGGAATKGGAIYNDGGIVSITNSTFTGNKADFGAVLNNSLGTVTVTNATIYDNSITGVGTGILYINGSTTLKNTILADGNGAALCVGLALIASSTNNLSDDLTCGPGFTVVTVGQLALGALTNNGGSTSTFGLLPDSIAIGTGNNTFCPATDQRGVGRPQGTLCDVGSFESKISLAVSPTSLGFGSNVIGVSSLPKTVTVTNTGEANLVIGVITITTAIPGEFNIINDACSGATLIPGATNTPGTFCTFDVTFVPTTNVAKTGTVSIPSNILTSPTTIALSGTGVYGTNLLKSPNFDVISIPIMWRNPQPPYTLRSVLDCGISFSYPCSVRFTGNSYNRLRQIYQGFMRVGKPGMRFLIGLSSKADGPMSPGGLYEGVLELYNPGGMVASYPLVFTDGTHDWEHLSMIVVAPANFSQMVFRIALRKTSGTAWFDNAYVIPLP